MASDRCLMAITIAMVCMTFAGCGSPKTVPFALTVTIDGKPLPDASVTLVRSDAAGGRAAFGLTDSGGVATFTSYKPGDGVPPGSYQVVVIKAPENAYTFEEPDPNDAQAMIRGSAMGDAASSMLPKRGKRVRSTIPNIYADPGTTPLLVEVQPGTKTNTIDLSSTP